ncbi:MAG TPA: exonuclease subunit SbcD, partial [Actinomycetota bacterium]|nr:exonuclease subunit SbcD [Actinomycetota bacterium]
MRILHTGDWHVGKKLGRIDRSRETEAVLDEVVAIATDQSVDLVVVAGDLFDRGLPPFQSLRLVLETLVRLADTGARVVAIPGNHDSSELFDVLTPHLAHSNVTIRHKTLRPEEGGVVTLPSRDGSETAQIACFPFLHESTVVAWAQESDDKFKSYADRVRDICRAYADSMIKSGGGKTVDILAAHFMVHGAVPSGSERELHIGEAYMARENAVPNVHYAALGHIHKAQGAPGSEDRARYCGSLMQLDFGEAGQDKSVCVVDVTPSGRRKVEQIPVTAGRQLVRLHGTLDQIAAKKDEVGDAIIAVDVVTDGPAP